MPDILGTVSHIYSRLCEKAPDAAKILDASLARGVILNTTYSGLGTPEVAARMLEYGWSSCQKTPSSRPRTVCSYSASDINDHARQALLGHCRDSMPEHVFGDIVKRLPAHIEEQARLVTEDALANGTGRPDEDGLALVKALRAVLSKTSFQDQNYCYRHNRGCPLSPSAPRCCQGLAPISMQVAGVMCTPWSSMNAGKFVKWFNVATLPCMVLVYYLLEIQPHIIIIENVRHFDFETFVEPFLVNNLYKHCVLPLSPVDEGIPTGQSRKFLICLNVSKFSGLLTKSLEPAPLMETVFHRTLIKNVGVYSDVVSQKDVLDWKATMLQLKGWQLLIDGEEKSASLRAIPARKCLPGSLGQRLAGYLAEYEADTAAGGPLLDSCWIDLNQTVHFYQRVTDVAPPLLATSKTWDMAKRRPVTLREQLVAMGFCPPLGEETERQDDEFLATMASLTSLFWPWWKGADATMPETFLNTSRLGNGMHATVIGIVLALSLSFATPSADAES